MKIHNIDIHEFYSLGSEEIIAGIDKGVIYRVSGVHPNTGVQDILFHVGNHCRLDMTGIGLAASQEPENGS